LLRVLFDSIDLLALFGVYAGIIVISPYLYISPVTMDILDTHRLQGELRLTQPVNLPARASHIAWPPLNQLAQ